MELNEKIKYQLQNAGLAFFMVFATYAAGQSMIGTPLEANMSLMQGEAIFVVLLILINIFRPSMEKENKKI